MVVIVESQTTLGARFGVEIEFWRLGKKIVWGGNFKFWVWNIGEKLLY